MATRPEVGDQIRLLVFGSREWSDAGLLRATMIDLLIMLGWTHSYPQGAVVVHGGARGADIMSGEIAASVGIPVEVHPADWDRHGKGAGPIRNEEMAKLGARFGIAAWDGKSPGTLDMMRRCVHYRIPVLIP